MANDPATEKWPESASPRRSRKRPRTRTRTTALLPPRRLVVVSASILCPQRTRLTLLAGPRKAKIEDDIDVPQPETLQEARQLMASEEEAKLKREECI